MQKMSRLPKRLYWFAALLVLCAAVLAGVGLSADGSDGAVPRPDITTLNLDRDGADISPVIKATAVTGPDITTLNLDRDGADILEDNWQVATNASPGFDSGPVATGKGPDITTLNLDRDGADIEAD